MKPPILAEFRSVTRQFGELVAIRDLNFTIVPGQVVGLLGPNGAGKTTCVRMLVGLLPPTQGSVTLAGIDVASNPIEAKRHIGFVPDGAPLYPNLSPLQLLALVGGLYEVPEGLLQQRSQHLLESLDLADRARDPVGQFSRGMRQKVALACALVHKPELLILDEPLSGLDAPSASIIKEVLRGWADQGGAVLYTSHLLDVVERVCDHMLIISHGTCVGSGTLEELNTMAGTSGTLEHVFLHLSHSEDPSLRAAKLLAGLADESA
ncbi:MAG TPA: ABC transporter ATP-binding protein [Planctomycetota bacterium]|nr:ABC transporter ATP-binding protein [Planctomycetota bacterium]